MFQIVSVANEVPLTLYSRHSSHGAGGSETVDLKLRKLTRFTHHHHHHHHSIMINICTYTWNTYPINGLCFIFSIPRVLAQTLESHEISALTKKRLLEMMSSVLQSDIRISGIAVAFVFVCLFVCVVCLFVFLFVCLFVRVVTWKKKMRINFIEVKSC